MPERDLTLLGVPIDCAGEPGGTELSPRALRRAGIADRLGARDAGDAAVAIRGRSRDPASGVLALESVVATISGVRDAVRLLLRDGAWPLLLAGDCTAAIGACGALRDFHSRIGLAYVDGHLDLYDGRTSPTGESADLPLAVICGHGPLELRAAAHLADPLVDPSDVALLGPRDLDEARSYGSIEPSDLAEDLLFCDVAAVRERPAASGERGAAHAARRTDGFWLHLDLDVLDEAEFPATDYLLAGGLRWPDLVELARPLAASTSCLGMTVACFNPEKDSGGAHATRIVEALQALLGAPEPRRSAAASTPAQPT